MSTGLHYLRITASQRCVLRSTHRFRSLLIHGQVQNIAILPTRDTLGDFRGNVFSTFLGPHFNALISENKPCLVHRGDYFNVEAEGRQIRFKIVDISSPGRNRAPYGTVTAETLFHCEGYPVEGESGSVGFVERVETQLPFRPASASPLAPACSDETPAAFEADGTDGTHPKDALGEPLTTFQGIHAGKDSMQMIRARGKFSVGSITCGDGSTQIIQVEGDVVGSNFRCGDGSRQIIQANGDTNLKNVSCGNNSLQIMGSFTDEEMGGLIRQSSAARHLPTWKI
jgi:hypothetical protein